MNVEHILNQYNIRYATSGGSIRHGFIGMDCPWCCVRRGEHYLGINLSKGYASCWRCGPKRLVDILVEVAKIPLREAIDATQGIRWALPAARAQGHLKLPDNRGPLLPAHTAYLERRGFDPQQLVSLWGLEGIGLSARLKWRIFIPITHYGEVVSWTTRSIGNRPDRRYVSASPAEESMPARSLLYGADLARNAVVVVEGPADAWAIGPGAVATLGVGFTRAQIDAIASYQVIVIAFDNEQTAQQRAHQLAAAVVGVSCSAALVIAPESGKDWASADESEIEEIRKQFLD